MPTGNYNMGGMPAPPQSGSLEAEMQQMADSLPPDKWEEIKAYVQSLPEGEREQWFADFTASHSEGRVDAQDAMTRADSLRVDQPGMIDAGGYKVAASPLAHIGAGMQNYQANKQYKQGQADLATANQGAAGQRAQGAKAAVGPMGAATPGINPAGGGMGGAIRSMAGGGPAGRGAGPGMTPEMLKMMQMQYR